MNKATTALKTRIHFPVYHITKDCITQKKHFKNRSPPSNGRTSEITVALYSSNSAVPIWRNTGNHPHHGDRGLRGALEHMDGLDLATATWKQSKGFPRARGQRCRVMGSGHDDRLSTDWGAYAEADTIYLMCFSKLVICGSLKEILFARLPGAL